VLTAQTGGAFSVYENPGVFNDQCSASVANICFPVQQGALPHMDGKTPAGPNRTVLYGNLYDPLNPNSTLTDLGTFCAGAPDPGVCFSSSTSTSRRAVPPRNSFRTPGYWNFDARNSEEFPSSPGRVRVFSSARSFSNLFNHSNLYADPNSNLLAAGEVESEARSSAQPRALRNAL